MNLHEYQAKELFRRQNVRVPEGGVAFSVEDAAARAAELIRATGHDVVVVKAQIHAGGRGKAGGVQVVRGAEEATRAAKGLLGKTLVTHQTGAFGKRVERLLIEQGLDIARELYLALLVDREVRRVAIIASTDGGVDIEEVAASRPERIVRMTIDPVVGLMPYQARTLSEKLLLDKAQSKQFAQMLHRLVSMFVQGDISLLEINPLIITKQGDVVALDGKVTLDDSAEYRHPEWADLRDASEENPVEVEAKKAGLSYVQLDGNIGCLVNGAGLAMATMDIIKHFGGEPANFLDVGGSASKEAVAKAFSIIVRDPEVNGIFVNIFGGIMKCDVIARGVIAASHEIALSVPLVVRLEGTNVEEGRRLLTESGLAVTPANTMAEGAEQIVNLVKNGK
ncbi:MAG: ADP-forming succinate--CoA ligase subunit beta [Myxococcales bacterium]|nr:ADP-forming succinate--CoA ligase subunit beta [Myxococcales bacterium]MCB9708725.1 ADP-forming succinate--CoA ligase subunit beta [Myxococcales bacterium]